jgi:cyclophilin family peptidyl-prolyl cis-trans isomerase
LFQEYSPNFEHKKYTLGFAGRPGGPDFYISTMDNSKLHGPGGQTSYEDPTEADPCFAKVVEGFNVVDRMGLSPVKPGNYKAMVHSVAIVSMKLMQEEKVEQKVEQKKDETVEENIDVRKNKILAHEKADKDSAGFKALLNEKRKKRIGKKGSFGNLN